MAIRSDAPGAIWKRRAEYSRCHANQLGRPWRLARAKKFRAR